MQNRYVGDIGDFGKYILLKAIAKQDLRLGVVWYLNRHEEGNQDGNLLGYLGKGRESVFRPCDCELYDALRKLHLARDRSVAAVENRKLLPKGTVFCKNPLPDLASRADRKGKREEWSEAAFALMKHAELVFLD